MRLALASCALLGCAYQPGSFHHAQLAFAGQRATVGCLDLAVERRADLSTGAVRGPVLAYQFANRCDGAALVDLGAVRVVGRSADGAELALAPYDPSAELHPVALDARSAGAEALAYPAAGAMPQACADAASVVHEAPPRWLCFGAPAAPPVAPSAPSLAASPVAPPAGPVVGSAP